MFGARLYCAGGVCYISCGFGLNITPDVFERVVMATALCLFTVHMYTVVRRIIFVKVTMFI